MKILRYNISIIYLNKCEKYINVKILEINNKVKVIVILNWKVMSIFKCVLKKVYLVFI